MEAQETATWKEPGAAANRDFGVYAWADVDDSDTREAGEEHRLLYLTIVKLNLNADSNNDGPISEDDDPVEENSPGMIVGVDKGDSDYRPRPLVLSCSEIDGATVELRATVAGRVRVQSAGGGAIALPKTWDTSDVPSDLEVVGLGAGELELELAFKDPGGNECGKDVVVLTVVDARIVKITNSTQGYDLNDPDAVKVGDTLRYDGEVTPDLVATGHMTARWECRRHGSGGAWAPFGPAQVDMVYTESSAGDFEIRLRAQTVAQETFCRSGTKEPGASFQRIAVVSVSIASIANQAGINLNNPDSIHVDQQVTYTGAVEPDLSAMTYQWHYSTGTGYLPFGPPAKTMNFTESTTGDFRIILRVTLWTRTFDSAPWALYVADITNGVVNSNRTVRPIEVSYPIHEPRVGHFDHFEVNNTFRFDLTRAILPPAPYPTHVGWLIVHQEEDGSETIITSGTGIAPTYAFRMNSDEGQTETEFYWDADRDGRYDAGEIFLESPEYTVMRRRVYDISVQVSNLVPLTQQQIQGCFDDAGDLLMMKDGPNDWRACVAFNCAAFAAFADPGAVVWDNWAQCSPVVAGADISFIDNLVGAGGVCWGNSRHQIILDGTANTAAWRARAVAHEFGHGVGLEHAGHVSPELMHGGFLGNVDRQLFYSDVDNYDGR